MVACKTVGECKRNQEKIRKFCLEEKAALAKQQVAKAKQTQTTPLQPAKRHKINQDPARTSSKHNPWDMPN